MVCEAIMIKLIVLLTDSIQYVCRYMQHNDDPTFADFEAFGGWNKPTMKQYSQEKHSANKIRNKKSKFYVGSMVPTYFVGITCRKHSHMFLYCVF